MTTVLLLRRVARIAVVSGLTVGVLPLAQAGRADDIRTDTTLGGFSVSVEAAPLKVLLDDPNATIPRPTGTAVVEGDPNYTLASVSSGPNARAVGSTLWPGNLFGEGLAQVAPGAPAYPLKAEARYPDKPYTSDGKDGGQLTHASALGLDAVGTALGAPPSIPGQVDIGDVQSVSTATVNTKNVAVGKAVSKVSDIDLLGGVIHIGSVSTELSASSDAKHPTSSGNTTVSGFTVAGQGYTVDSTGAHAAGTNNALPSLSGLDPLKALGVTVSGITQSSTHDTDSATRSATGLAIKIDTAALKAALSPVLGALTSPYNTVVSTFIPPAQQGNFYYLINATPSITFVIGAGDVTSAAVLPISFTFPTTGFPGGGLVGPPGLGTAQTGTPPVSTNPGLGTGVPPVAPTGPGPVLNAPGMAPAASSGDAGFGGIKAGWLALALLVSGGLAYLLMRLLGFAAGAPLGFGCRLGAPTSVPNLRSVTT
jgi:hypothetical protein